MSAWSFCPTCGYAPRPHPTSDRGLSSCCPSCRYFRPTSRRIGLSHGGLSPFTYGSFLTRRRRETDSKPRSPATASSVIAPWRSIAYEDRGGGAAAAVQPDFGCSASHSMEPIDHMVGVGCGLWCCSVASAYLRRPTPRPLHASGPRPPPSALTAHGRAAIPAPFLLPGRPVRSPQVQPGNRSAP